MLPDQARTAHPTFDVANTELMDIDIRPQDALVPVLDISASQNPARIYLASLSNGSHRTMVGALNLSATVLSVGRCDHHTLPWWLLRKAHTNALRAWLMQHRSAATGNKVLSAVRGTLRAAWDLDQLDTDAYMKAVSIKAIPGSRPDQAAGRALAAGEFAALLRICAADRTAAGVRDAALLGLGVLAGLRRAELAGLQLADYRASVLWVRGKRNKERTVPVAAGVSDALADWLHLRGGWSGPLFTAILKSGQIQTKEISEAAIYQILQKRASQAGVNAFSPHDLRRTFAGDLLDAGADIATVQKLMCHANVATTAGYDRRGERAKHSAIGRLHMPWTRRFAD
jgi:site-specific recombinase XerD